MAETEFSIRVAQETDARAVHDIYAYYVENTAVTFTTVNPTVEEYAEKIRTVKRMYPFFVLEQGGRVVGFAYGGQVRPHDAYIWNVEATVYLAPDAPRRTGMGSALYQALIDTLTRQGFKAVFGVITASNEPSLALHRSLGFVKAGVFENMGFKNGAWHGIVWMQKTIGAPEASPALPTPFCELK